MIDVVPLAWVAAIAAFGPVDERLRS